MTSQCLTGVAPRAVRVSRRLLNEKQCSGPCPKLELQGSHRASEIEPAGSDRSAHLHSALSANLPWSSSRADARLEGVSNRCGASKSAVRRGSTTSRRTAKLPRKQGQLRGLVAASIPSTRYSLHTEGFWRAGKACSLIPLFVRRECDPAGETAGDKQLRSPHECQCAESTEYSYCHTPGHANKGAGPFLGWQGPDVESCECSSLAHRMILYTCRLTV